MKLWRSQSIRGRAQKSRGAFWIVPTYVSETEHMAVSNSLNRWIRWSYSSLKVGIKNWIQSILFEKLIRWGQKNTMYRSQRQNACLDALNWIDGFYDVRVRKNHDSKIYWIVLITNSCTINCTDGLDGDSQNAIPDPINPICLRDNVHTWMQYIEQMDKMML